MALTHLLDTNTCIYIINRRPPHVAEKFAEFPPDAIGLSAITLAKLRYGVEKRGSKQNAEVLEAFTALLEIVAFEADTPLTYARIRSDPENKGTPIGAMDLLIAAHVLSLDLTLATPNRKEFDRVGGLKVENWFVSENQ